MASSSRPRWQVAVAATIAVALAGGAGVIVARLPRSEPAAPRPGSVARPGPAAPTSPEDAPPPLDRRPRPRAGAPNVVVVVTCTMRRDQLTPYGGPPETTPWMAEMAGRGVRFDDLVAASAWTKESVTAILAGQMAIDVGMIDPSDALGRRRVAPDVTTLAERLTGAGWWAVGRTANPHINAEFGFAQGMDRYQGTVDTGFARNHKLSAADLVAASLQDLRDRTPEEAARPFYLQLVVIDPHWPITPEPRELAPFAGDPERLAAYRAMVRRVDDALAALDAGLRDLGHGDDTLVVVTADHGEGLDMPPHHRGQHGRVLYRSLTQVGWLLAGPGVGHGVVVDGLASHLDVVPTILGLAGLPTTAPTDELQTGHDWSDLVKTGGRTTRARAVADTWYEGANRASIWTSERECQRDWGSKRIRRDSFETACYDRVADPDFTIPVDDPALAGELVTWRTAAEGRYAAFSATGDAPDDAAVRDQLEALGYAE